VWGTTEYLCSTHTISITCRLSADHMNIPLRLLVPVLSSTGVSIDKRVLHWIGKEARTKRNKKAAWHDKIGMLARSYVLSDRHQEIAAAWRKKTGFFLHIPVSMMMVEQRIMSQGKWRSKFANRKKRDGKNRTRYDILCAWNKHRYTDCPRKG
jgi:hypothetical protein